MTSSTTSSVLQTEKMTTKSAAKTPSGQTGSSTISTEKKASTTSGFAQTGSSEGTSTSTVTSGKPLRTSTKTVSPTSKSTNFQETTSPTSPAKEDQTEKVTSSSKTTENGQKITTATTKKLPQTSTNTVPATANSINGSLTTSAMKGDSTTHPVIGKKETSKALPQTSEVTTPNSNDDRQSSRYFPNVDRTTKPDVSTESNSMTTNLPTTEKRTTSETIGKRSSTEMISTKTSTEATETPVTYPNVSDAIFATPAPEPLFSSQTVSQLNERQTTSGTIEKSTEQMTSTKVGVTEDAPHTTYSNVSDAIFATPAPESLSSSQTSSRTGTTVSPLNERQTTSGTTEKSTEQMTSTKVGVTEDAPHTTYSNVSDAIFATPAPESLSSSQTSSRTGTTVSPLNERQTTSGTTQKSTEQMTSTKVGVTEDAPHTTYSNVSDAIFATPAPESSSSSEGTSSSRSAASQTVPSDPLLTKTVSSTMTTQSASLPNGSSSSTTTTTSRPSSTANSAHQKPSPTTTSQKTKSSVPHQKTTTSSPTPFSSSQKESSTSTTENPLCGQQCPTGYLIGTSYCFKLAPASTRINSYQSALSHCKTVERQTLASLDKIKETADIKMIQESAGLQNIDWIYANGIGGKKERFEKLADVYSVYSQTLVSSPILMTVGISEKFGNISALCVLPKYCNPNECDVEKLFLAYDYYSRYKQSAGLLLPRKSGSVSCIYGNQKTTTVTCNNLGAIYPNPSNIDCEESATERTIRDTTNETVSSCDVCFRRGTKQCLAIIDYSTRKLKGYRCVCKEPYKMASCWRTMNLCNSTVCGKNGVCRMELDQMTCDCKWGYTGDRCEIKLKKLYNGNIGYSSAVGATITLGGWIFRAIKLLILGFSMSTDQGEDPQDTHQSLRSYCMTGAGIILTLWSNPTVFGIDQAACRFYFIGIHFCYIMAMMQWFLEGVNVNQVLRCVHTNEWESVDRNGRRSWGVRVITRLAVPAVVVAVWLLMSFQYGWNQLAADWTCVGVICQQTLSVWFPIFGGVFILFLLAGAIFESSRLIKSRRPLLAYQLDLMVERRLGQTKGHRVQKCRYNDTNCLIGLLLLIALWLSVIVSSDHRDEQIYGIITVVCAGIYSAFCTYQEIVTSPEDYAQAITLLQRWAPGRFAPDYNPMTMWTIDEIKDLYKLPKAERKATYEGLLTFNQKLFLHHRWDVLLNKMLVEHPKMEIDGAEGAIVKLFKDEVRNLIKHRGTYTQLAELKEAYAAYCLSIPHNNPREAGIVNGRLELVTLAVDHPQDGIKLAKFFIVPGFHTFEPAIPERGESKKRRKQREHERQLMTHLEQEIYELGRAEAIAQNKFINSSILFFNYGNHVVR